MDGFNLDDLLVHREWVARVARGLAFGDAEAEDLTQQTWVRILQHPPTEAPRAPRGWLRTVLRYVAIERVRAADVRRRHERAAARPERDDATPASLAARAEMLDRLVHAVLALDEPYRGTVLLRYFEDLKPGEIALRQGIPTETVRTRLRRAIEVLRTCLGATKEGRGRDALLLLVALPRGRKGWAVPGGVLVAKKAVAVAVAVVLLVAGGWWFGIRDGKPGGGGPPAAFPPPVAASPGAKPLPPTAGPGAESPAVVPPAAPRPLRTVGGRVLDAEGRPVVAACVVSVPDNLERPLDMGTAMEARGPCREARSGEGGRFTLEIPDDAATVSLAAEGEERGNAIARGVRPGRDVDLVLERAATLTGKVTDLRGRLVAGAVVRLATLRDRVRVVREGVSGEYGDYRVEGIPGNADLATLTVEAKGWAPALRLIESPRSGETPTLDVALGGLSVLVGRVLHGRTREPVPGLRVVLCGTATTAGAGWVRSTSSGGRTLVNPDAWKPLGETRSGADGTYRIEELPQGGVNPFYNVWVGAFAEGWTVALQQVTLGNPGDEVRLDLLVWPAATIEGRVLEGEAPAAGITVNAPVTGADGATWLPAIYGECPSWWGVSDAEGRYRLRGVPVQGPGVGRVQVNAFQRGVMFQHGQIVDKGAWVDVEVRAGAATTAPDLRLPAFEAAVVDFLVVDREGVPVAGAEFSAHDSPLNPRTDREGRARLAWAPETAGRPRGVIVRARGFGPEAALVRPAVETTGTAGPSGAAPSPFRVVLPDGHRLRGRVLRRTAVEGARVQVWIANGRLPLEEAMAPAVGEPGSAPRIPPLRVYALVPISDDGSFVVDDLPPGPWFVKATEYIPAKPEGMSPARTRETPVQTLAGGEAEVLLELP